MEPSKVGRDQEPCDLISNTSMPLAQVLHFRSASLAHSTIQLHFSSLPSLPHTCLLLYFCHFSTIPSLHLTSTARSVSAAATMDQDAFEGQLRTKLYAHTQVIRKGATKGTHRFLRALTLVFFQNGRYCESLISL